MAPQTARNGKAPLQIPRMDAPVDTTSGNMPAGSSSQENGQPEQSKTPPVETQPPETASEPSSLAAASETPEAGQETVMAVATEPPVPESVDAAPFAEEPSPKPTEATPVVAPVEPVEAPPEEVPAVETPVMETRAIPDERPSAKPQQADPRKAAPNADISEVTDPVAPDEAEAAMVKDKCKTLDESPTSPVAKSSEEAHKEADLLSSAPATEPLPTEALVTAEKIPEPQRPTGEDKSANKTCNFIWRTEDSLRTNAALLGQALHTAHPHLYATPQGLVEALPAVRVIDNARRLAPILIDRLDIQMMRGGKIVGDLPPERSLNALLASEPFLRCFKPVDLVTYYPVYLADFTLAPSGYYDGGAGQRILSLGPQPQIAGSMEAWDHFLAVMDFDSEASRTNTIGAALTVLLRHHFPGNKPLILVTANQSHAGKGTVIVAICGRVRKALIRYGDKDWPMESALHQKLNDDPEIGFIDLDNVRTDSAGGGGGIIRSGFFESLVTSSEVQLNSPTGGSPISRPNDLVLGLNTNEGTVSPDMLNRSLWSHLAPQGDIHERRSPIGNPKHEYLPQHQQQMEAELHGMIARWRDAGCPLADVYHPMSLWAKTVGGILQVAGYKDFLANYGLAARQIDPQRRAIAILGAACPGKPMRPADWAQLAVDQGLTKSLFSPADRDTSAGRERGIGVIFKRFLTVPLEAETETKRLRLKLSKEYKRWDCGQNGYIKYTFAVVEELPLESGMKDVNTPTGDEAGQ